VWLASELGDIAPEEELGIELEPAMSPEETCCPLPGRRCRRALAASRRWGWVGTHYARWAALGLAARAKRGRLATTRASRKESLSRLVEVQKKWWQKKEPLPPSWRTKMTIRQNRLELRCLGLQQTVTALRKQLE
jgi:hypothetical protein